MLERLQVIGVCRARPGSPGARLRSFLGTYSRSKFRHARNDHEVGVIHTPELIRVGVDMDELLLRPRNTDKRIAGRRGFTQTRPDRDQQIGISHALSEFGIDADAHVTGKVRMPIVDEVLPPEGCRDGKLKSRAKRLDVRACLCLPVASTQDHKWSLGRSDHRGHPADIRCLRRGLHSLIRRGIGGIAFRIKHILRQRDHHRTRPPGARDVKRAAQELRHASHIVDLRGPLRDGREHACDIDLLPRLTSQRVPAHLPHEQDKWCRVLPSLYVWQGRCHGKFSTGIERASASGIRRMPQRPPRL